MGCYCGECVDGHTPCPHPWGAPSQPVTILSPPPREKQKRNWVYPETEPGSYFKIADSGASRRMFGQYPGFLFLVFKKKNLCKGLGDDSLKPRGLSSSHCGSWHTC